LAPRTTARELLCALFVALALAAVPVGRALVDPSRIFSAIDTATSTLSETGRDTESSNPGDPGIALYPAYRWSIERLCRGEIPTWNPRLAAGVPWLANPQWGVLDPQVLALAALEKVGGRNLSDRGFAWLAWLRLAAAGLGAYVLARRLGLSPLGASLAAAGFAGSGTLLAWLGASVGHVAPLLPWVLVALERMNARPSARGVVLIALATALMILGGDPETAFFCGLAALVWTACTLRGRAQTLGVAGLAVGVLLAAPVLVPFVEYLQHSSALAAHRSQPAGRIDLLALGLVAILATLVVAWRGIDAALERAGSALAGAVGVALALATCALVLASRSSSEAARTLVLFDALGNQSRELSDAPWSGPGTYAEAAIVWVPTVVLALALAAFCARSGPLRARNVAQSIAFGALLLAVAAPGAVDVWHWIPFFGHGSAARAAAVSALFLALLAGEALESATRDARRAAAIGLAALVCAALVARTPETPRIALDPPDELVAITERPAALLSEESTALAGWIRSEVKCDALQVRAEPVDSLGRRRRGEALVLPVGLEAPDAAGRRAFRSEAIRMSRLVRGTWRFTLEVLRRRSTPTTPTESPTSNGEMDIAGKRVVAASTLAPIPFITPRSAVFALLSFLAVLFAAGSRNRIAWVAVALAFVQALAFAQDLPPSVPRTEYSRVTETERILAEEAGGLGAPRVLGGPGVLPGNTALLTGLSTMSGGDALGVESFDIYRAAALKPGAQLPLDWNALGVDLRSPAFRALGVSELLLRERAGPAESLVGEFELVAGPASDLARHAEIYVYRAKQPFPRAFCVSRIVERALAGVGALDPEHEAFLEPANAWRPAVPFTHAKVEHLAIGDARVRADVELDGDGLFVLSDQAFPGWKAFVDDRETDLFTADTIFRAVPLARGAHTIEMRYEPDSVRIGAWIGIAAFVALWILALVPRRLR
jgi:hypothetical protein